eukprot:CAMPEP_0206146766 /NCGR_PEP_ID=MMETSP1473-20131121/31359_1 /ASSEMBLY_ACC=CAM_ASM_001109 /TAXON_ID=1461547 /ORGANISM="Stichococcus sp, Strain RCC1054" /LENGTH=222 /DNA_ID=CAMNT_0053543449 /DNA_START=174 /DNA_END=842 /DNA_ORIENTATION=+
MGRINRLSSRRMLLHSTRCFSTEAGVPNVGGDAEDDQEDDDDIVVSVFNEENERFRAYMKEAVNIVPPLEGDEAAIRKYSEQLESLRNKVGAPTANESLEAQLEYGFEVAGRDASTFLANASEGIDLGELEGCMEELQEAAEDVDFDDEEEVEDFKETVMEIRKNYGLDDYENLKDKAMMELYMNQVQDMRTSVVEAMDTVKRRDGLEKVNVDLSSLKPARK